MKIQLDIPKEVAEDLADFLAFGEGFDNYAYDFGCVAREHLSQNEFFNIMNDQVSSIRKQIKENV